MHGVDVRTWTITHSRQAGIETTERRVPVECSKGGDAPRPQPAMEMHLARTAMDR
jgi:hypothetical protein